MLYEVITHSGRVGDILGGCCVGIHIIANLPFLLARFDPFDDVRQLATMDTDRGFLEFGTGTRRTAMQYLQNARLVGRRITSYNVCYTKLLRVAGERDRHADPGGRTADGCDDRLLHADDLSYNFV